MVKCEEKILQHKEAKLKKSKDDQAIATAVPSPRLLYK